jgi:hypothetical protein
VHEGHEGLANYYISISSFVLPSTLLGMLRDLRRETSVAILIAALPR